MQNTTYMDECMHSFNVNMHNANAIVENLIPNISNKGQIPLISKGYRRPIPKIEHMTPSLIQKENPKGRIDRHWCQYSIFIFVIWLPHASSFLGVHLRFRFWPLCSPLSVVIYSFCSLSIRSRFWINSWSTIFSSSSVFGSHDHSFDFSMVDEEPTLAMGTFSFGIVAFLRCASFGVSFSCFGTSTFVLDESSTSAGLPKSSIFSFPSLIRSRTLRWSAVQFSVEWPGFPAW